MAIQIIPILKAITPLIGASSGIVATLGERLAHPTGARGWMYAWKHTDEARQILVTGVAKGSPADGVLQADDVILGANGKPFADDARIQFARPL